MRITNNPVDLVASSAEFPRIPVLNSLENLTDNNLEPNTDNLNKLNLPLIILVNLDFGAIKLKNNLPNHFLHIFGKPKRTILHNFLLIFLKTFHSLLI